MRGIVEIHPNLMAWCEVGRPSRRRGGRRPLCKRSSRVRGLVAPRDVQLTDTPKSFDLYMEHLLLLPFSSSPSCPSFSPFSFPPPFYSSPFSPFSPHSSSSFYSFSSPPPFSCSFSSSPFSSFSPSPFSSSHCSSFSTSHSSSSLYSFSSTFPPSLLILHFHIQYIFYFFGLLFVAVYIFTHPIICLFLLSLVFLFLLVLLLFFFYFLLLHLFLLSLLLV